MRIKFNQDRETILFGPVAAGEIKDLPKKEAQAFIDNGVADKAKAEKAKEKQGDE